MNSPAELVRAIVENRAVIFVGAGLSVGAGLPTWSKLVAPLKKEIEDCPEDISPLDVAQYYQNEHGPAQLASQLARQLDVPSGTTSEAHRLVVRLQPCRIYTTNFDNLLEAACEAEKRKHQRITNPAQLALASADKIGLIKLHGDLEDPEKMVLTAETFEDYFSSHAILAKKFSSDLMENTVLFLGYSFTDPDMRTILRSVRKDSEGFAPRHYIVQYAPRGPVIKELERRGLKVIALADSAGAAASHLQWLQSLYAEVEKKRPQPKQPNRQTATHNLPERQKSLVGRTAEFKQLLSRLEVQQVVYILGSPGVGKTSLAIKAAYECAMDYPRFEYVVWLTARNKPDQKFWLNEVLNTIANTLGFPGITQKPAERINEKLVFVNGLLEDRRVLIVLDNFETVQDHNLAKWIISVPSSSRVLITAISEHTVKPKTPQILLLKGLQEDDALTLLREYESGFVPTPEGLKQRRDLIGVTLGNPQAIKLALGIAQASPDGFKNITDDLRAVGANIDQIFEFLFDSAWKLIRENAERLLLVTPLFTGLASIRREALEASTGLKREDFEEALEQVLQFGLLEPLGPKGPYLIHSKTRAYAVAQLAGRAKLETEARERCAMHYLGFVREAVIRANPNQRYWNALVTDGMKLIDPEWPIIRELMDWTQRDRRHDFLIPFVMLLVHYLDSRFLNLERMSYVLAALASLEAIRFQKIKAISYVHGAGELPTECNAVADEALLRIDAIGWTYVEESRLNGGFEEIDKGYMLATTLNTDEKVDLMTLANAWRARIRAEEKNSREAEELIVDALSTVEQCKPWIKLRVYMAAGDIALKNESYEDALAKYEAAAESAKAYGGEGGYKGEAGGYQIDPRIGMAMVNLRDRLDDAEAKFEAVGRQETIPIGHLYGDYGKALVEHKRGNVQLATELVRKAREQLKQRTNSHLLLNLLNELYGKLEIEQSSAENGHKVSYAGSA